MASETSSPCSLTPLQPLQLDSLNDDNVQKTPFSLLYGGRLPYRVRLRQIIILFAVVIATLVLFSRRSLFSESSLDTVDSLPPVSSSFTAVQTTEPVVFALIMHSEDSAREGAVLLKSAIMYTSRPLEFHIICDDDAIVYLENRLRLLTHPVHPVTVRLYRTTFESMMNRLAREGSLHTGHPSGTPGLMKLFLHEVLPDNVEKAIFVDTDAFFLVDPALLWEEFSRWGPNIAVSIPYHPELVNKELLNATEICSCIMLLHLDRLRSVRLMDSSIYRADRSGLYPPALSPPTFTALFGPPGPDGYQNAMLGDQSYWWAIVSNRREIFNPLSLDWEVTTCLLEMYGTSLGNDGISEEDEKNTLFHLGPHQGTIVVPKLLHFNCMQDPVFYESPAWSDPETGLYKRWGAAVNYHFGFKWLWLNRGHTESPVDIQVIVDPLFSDQRFAAEHPEAIDPTAPGIIRKSL